MKLSLSIEASEDSEDGNSTEFSHPDIKIYSTGKAAEVLEEYLREILPASENYDKAEISITFMKPEEIRALNREYRDVDEATDVLSFPMIDGLPKGLPVLMLGDIVICPEKVKELHPELSEREAISLMISHSFLHLLGYDHETEEEQSAMWAKQDEISRKILEAIQR